MAATAQKKYQKIDLPDVPAQYDACPDFAPGATSSGKWAVTANPGKQGLSVFITYDRKPVDVSCFGTYCFAFDFNVWENKDTYTCKWVSSIILFNELPEAAKKSIIDSYAQVKANQAVFKDVFIKFFAANPQYTENLLDAEGAKLTVKYSPIVKLKAVKPDPSKPNKDMTPKWQSSCTLQTDKSVSKEGGSVKEERIITPIILNGKVLENQTRGSIYELLKDKRFFKHTQGELYGFLRPGDGTFFMQVRSKKETLQQLAGRHEPTKDELKKMTDSSVSMFAGLGITMSDISEEAMKEAEEDSPSQQSSQPATKSPPIVDTGFGGFTEVESKK